MFQSPFNKTDIDIQKEKTAYRGFFRIKEYLLQHPLFKGDLSPVIKRELFCRGSAVGVLLYDPHKDTVGLVQQFRIGCLENSSGPWVWEVIAGINDKDESPEQIALREAAEESGLQLQQQQLHKICHYYASPGGSDENLHLYCAVTDLPNESGIFGVDDEAEDILFQCFAFESAINAMLAGDINNAATIIALQWLQLNRETLQQNTN